MPLLQSPRRLQAPVPAAKLASVTKKRLEIEELLPDSSKNLELIKTHFTEYLERVESLYEACKNEHQEWISQERLHIDRFRSRIEYILDSERKKFRSAPPPSISAVSTTSSAARIKLAEERATLIAKQAVLSKSLELEQKELELMKQHEKNLLTLNHQWRQVKSQEDKYRLDTLERELNNLDGIADEPTASLPLGASSTPNQPASVVQPPREPSKLPYCLEVSSQSFTAAQTQLPCAVSAQSVSAVQAQPSDFPLAQQSSTTQAYSSSIVSTGQAQQFDVVVERPCSYVQVPQSGTVHAKPYFATTEKQCSVSFAQPPSSVQAQPSSLLTPQPQPNLPQHLSAASFPQIPTAPIRSLPSNLTHDSFPFVFGNHVPPSFADTTQNTYNIADQINPLHRMTQPVVNRDEQLLRVLERQNELAAQMTLCQDRSSLPIKEITVFDGSDVTRFKSFLLNFDRIIEHRCQNDSDKLIYLEQYTAGKARKLVSSCTHSDPSLGYRTARKLLLEEYGNEYKVAQAYISKIKDWPPIKNDDSDNLQVFSIFLMECSIFFENMSVGNQLQSPTEIMNIVKKLPYKMRERWRRKTHEYLEKQGHVTFVNLVHFVKQEVSILKQPLFGEIADFAETKARQTVKAKRVLVTTSEDVPAAVSANNYVSKFCAYCNLTNHYISSCRKFKGLANEHKWQFLRKSELCFACLRSGHWSRDCNNPSTCAVCNGQHPTVLHDISDQSWGASSSSVSEEIPDVKNNRNGVGNKRVAYPVLPARVRIPGGDRDIVINCVLDSCSSDCWVSQSLLSMLGIKTSEKRINLTTMHSSQSSVMANVVNNLIISDLDNNFTTVIPVAYSTPETLWPFSKSDVISENDIGRFEFLHSIPFNFVQEEISLLVGINMPSLFKMSECVYRDENSPFASLYPLGWTISGPIPGFRSESLCNRINVHKDLNSLIENYFAQDFQDGSTETVMSIDDRKWVDKVEKSVRRMPAGNYEIELPFKDQFILPDNKSQALRSFENTLKRFNSNSKFCEDYRNFMQSMIDSEFMEIIPQNEINVPTGSFWYLSHHAVYHNIKKKIRVVFNCSQKFRGVSLNDVLLQGPDFTNSLFGVLLRFRQEQFAVVGDITKMFYQVKVPKHHSDFLRLFWLDTAGNIAHYRLKVHVFGATSSPSISNYALQRTVIDNLDHSIDVKNCVLRNFYVDDFLLSCYSEEKLASLLKGVKDLIATGGFDLTGFRSNSRTVLNEAAVSGTVHGNPVKLADSSEYENRTLGVVWDRINDKFGFDVKMAPGETVTKRKILKCVASIYDPIGAASPVIVVGRKLFQECCRTELDWDECLTGKLFESWCKWVNEISDLSSYRIDRPLSVNGNYDCLELHVFADGSETAYGSVAYLRFIHRNFVNVSFLASKSRLTPLSNSTLKTVPRIELCSAKLAIELSCKLSGSLDFQINSIYYWSDSITVLRYIKNESLRFQRFVSNKVDFIRNFSEPQQWFYVPSKQNPADLVSRGCSVNNLISSKLWNHGPDFISCYPNNFPSQVYDRSVSETDVEVRRDMVVCTTLESSTPIDLLMSSVSNWKLLKIRIAWMLKFKSVLRNKSSLYNVKLRVTDLHEAELVIVKYLQSSHYGKILSCLKDGKCPHKGNCLRKLNPFVDRDGLLRVGGRLGKSDLEYDLKHPIILPPAPITSLLVEDIHSSVGHLGRENVTNVVRRKYWLVKGSTLIRKVVRDCLICRKQQAKHCEQLMSDLPSVRLATDVKAFTNVGLDFFGPYNTVHGRRTEKRYGVIFTCLSSRAIHLEVAHSLTTDSFINSLRRFISRRGNVSTIVSDNGTNIVSGNKELRESIGQWNLSVVQNWLKQKCVDWQFNPPNAPHFGGIFEREIRTIKKVLNALLREQKITFNDEIFCTLLCEVESVLNNRPLTEVSSDPECNEALTPNHLLLFNAGVTLPPGVFTRDDCVSKRQWRRVQYLVNLFWARWRREYVVLLQERNKWQFSDRSLQPGDLVLVTDINLPRNQWPLGRVVTVHNDRKGFVRSATIRISKCKNTDLSNFATAVIERPITRLVLLRSEGELCAH